MPKTVLIADESITIRSVAESLLRGEAYSVRSAADGNMAMELAGAERPDLILVGEKLPGISGPDVCAQLKGNPAMASVPIIFMRTDRPGDSPANVDAVLTKPFSPQTLLDAVQRFLGGDREKAGAAHEVVAVEDQGLAEELIDKALGLEDIRSMSTDEPAQTAASEPLKTPAAKPMAEVQAPKPAKPLAAEAPAGPADEVASFEDFEVQLGMEDKAAVSRPADNDELDKALDAAFGDVADSGAGPGRAAGTPPPPQAPPSSLTEISLGDSQKVELPEVAGPGADTPDQGQPPADPEHPHDYEWFIAEMDKETGKASASRAKADDGPRIEPVQPQGQPEPVAPEAKSPPPPDRSTKSSEFDIDVEEFEESKRGYDEFISEFRKEIAKLEGAVPAEDGAEAESSDDDETKHTTKGQIALKDSKDALRMNADIKALGDRLIDAVAQSVARELAAKIDPKTVYAIIDAKLSEVGKPQS